MSGARGRASPSSRPRHGGLAFTTASRSVVFLYTVPFWAALGAHWLLLGERLHGAHVAGLVAALAGMALACADALRLPSHRELIGDVTDVAAGISLVNRSPRPG